MKRKKKKEEKRSKFEGKKFEDKVQLTDNNYLSGRVDLTLDEGSYETAIIRGFTRVREGRDTVQRLQPSTRLPRNFAFILAANFLTRYERHSREGVGGRGTESERGTINFVERSQARTKERETRRDHLISAKQPGGGSEILRILGSSFFFSFFFFSSSSSPWVEISRCKGNWENSCA